MELNKEIWKPLNDGKCYCDCSRLASRESKFCSGCGGSLTDAHSGDHLFVAINEK